MSFYSSFQDLEQRKQRKLELKHFADQKSLRRKQDNAAYITGVFGVRVGVGIRRED